MTIKQLFPTQRPALDLNFARQKRLDSRVTFTRASTGTYVGSDGLIKTAADNEARFDHDPETGESLGLLVEEARTNIQKYSTDFATQWTFAGTGTGVLYPNVALAPDNTFTASKLAAENTRYLKGSDNGLNLASGYARFDLATGSFIESIGDVTSYGIVAVGNGWYRVHMATGGYCASVYAKAAELSQIGIQLFGNGFLIYSKDGAASNTTNGILIWGAQMEAGAFPTSYIPTTSSTVTRSADVASLTNSSIYDTDSFTILNEPFGSAAGSSTLSLVGAGETPIKRTAVYSQELTQTQINASVGKTDEFWRWRILGSSFGLPSFTTDGQVTVDWGDGTVETLTTSDHTFTDGGGYHEIGFRLDSGTYFRPYINGNASQVTKVVAVGPAPESMRILPQFMFSGCNNFEAFDATVDTSAATNFYNAWNGCSSLTSFPLIDTSSGTNFTGTWSNCFSLTNFPLLDTSSGINFTLTWRNCNSLTSFPLIDTSSGTSFSEAWRDCNSLTSFPLINTSGGTDFNDAWRNCTSLTSFPLIDASSGTIFSGAWQGCTSLTSFPLIDASSGTIFSGAWYSCASLASFPAINTSSGTNFTNTWYGCNSLTSFPLIDTSSGTSFGNAWRNCTKLTSFPANFFDSWTGTPGSNCFTNTWTGCSLTATSVENILNSIDTSGQSAPGTGPDISISYDTGTGTPSIATAVTNLKARGWTITLNGVPQ